MSKKVKRLQYFLCLPVGYRYSEMVVLLRGMGYSKNPGGMTSGSVMSFSKEVETRTLTVHVHRPHPGDIMDPGAVKSVRNQLKRNGDLNN